ncbi:MAG: 1-propanol dehydrogenase PduQ [Propionibacteriaceae bacterium]|nr:1-propanol dehydrogenase PduQ [Propionibacteriaceae bacterium]
MGEGAVGALERHRQERVFLVSDEQLSQTAGYREVRSQFAGPVAEYLDVQPDPSATEVARGVLAYLECEPDVVVAFGGGSVIDAAKAMHHMAMASGGGARHGIVAIPTTSGSGSEVTSFSVVTDEEKQVKVPLISPNLIPTMAILDPGMVTSCPPRLTAYSGMDAVTHAIEAYVSTGANDFTDACAEKSIQLSFNALPRCYSQGSDLAVRERMHNASCLAAIAFDNAGLGLVHSLAHALGGRFHAPHGMLNAILLPHVIEFNATDPATARRYARLAQLCGFPANQDRVGALNLASRVRRLAEAVGVRGGLEAAAGIPRAELTAALTEVAETALADPCTTTNPVPATRADLERLLRSAT